MKNKVFLGITVRIVILFTVAMLATFIPENLRDFFGDTPALEVQDHTPEPDKYYDWGARHYWYWWMCVILFLLSMLNLFISVFNLVQKNYDTSDWK